MSASGFLPFTPSLMLFLQGCEHFLSGGEAVPSGVRHRGHKGTVSPVWLPNCDLTGSFKPKAWVWSEIKQAGSVRPGSGLALQRGRVWPAPRAVRNAERELLPFSVGAAPACNRSGGSLPAFHLRFVVGELRAGVRFLPSGQTSCSSALSWVVENQKPSLSPRCRGTFPSLSPTNRFAPKPNTSRRCQSPNQTY